MLSESTLSIIITPLQIAVVKQQYVANIQGHSMG